MTIKLSKAAIFLAIMLGAIPCIAGEKAGNGGDICEDRFKSVRDDIATWIKKGGSESLNFSSGINPEQYKRSMLKAISTAKISCVSEKIYVGSVEKFCKNYVDALGRGRIRCNREAFLALGAGQGAPAEYRLVHHEYAGLAGFEMTTDEGDSDYRISDQVTALLESQIIKKLPMSSNNAADIIPCHLIDHSKPVPVGTRCRTSQGGAYGELAIFERVNEAGFGEAWKGPINTSNPGVIWSDRIGKASQPAAVKACQNLGGILPEQSDFVRGEDHGFREVLPNMEGNYFWSSTLDPNYPDTAYGMRGDVGDAGWSIPFNFYGGASFRCIKRM